MTRTRESPMNMPFPQDDLTTYYLRNSYTQHYLYASGSNLTLDAKKVEDAFYQWRFIKDGKTSNYNLQNVGNDQHFNIVQYLSDNYSGYYSITMSNTTHSLSISGGSVFKMGVANTYCISDVGGVVYAVNANFWPGQGQAGRDEWHFEVIHNFPLVIKNPLPKGTYRIRSFNSSYLLTMPRVAQGDVGNPYVTQQDPNNDFQKWSLVPEGDGLYTIRNSGTSLYLAGSSSAKLVKGARLIGQSVANGEIPFQWKIDTFGPGIMFFIGLSDDRLSVGFPKYIAEDLSQVALQPSDNIPSQIWFFETFEPLSPATFHATRQLVSGTYILESCHSQQYLCVSADDFVVATSDPTNATYFTLEFVADYSPNFTLSYADANYGTFYLSVEKNRLVTCDEDEKSTWVLLPREYQGVGTVYFICDCTATEPRRVISCRKVKNRKRSYFALDALTEGDAMQFWKFCRSDEADPTAKDGGS